MDEIVSWKMTTVIDLDPFWTTNNLVTFQRSPIKNPPKKNLMYIFEMLQSLRKRYL